MLKQNALQTGRFTLPMNEERTLQEISWDYFMVHCTNNTIKKPYQTKTAPLFSHLKKVWSKFYA